ncbi:MAG TPA: hypothetical protein VGK17_12460 [Propionicimonas sp.]|jgi:hypothetical protein
MRDSGPVPTDSGEDVAVVHAVLADKWTWLVVGAFWALLADLCIVLAVDPPGRWPAVGLATALVLVFTKLTVAFNSLTLDAETLVELTGKRTVTLPLEAINRLEAEFMPKVGLFLRVATAQGFILIEANPSTLVLREELGRRLERRRPGLVVDDRVAQVLGWEPHWTRTEADALRERHRVVVTVGTAPPAAVCRVLLHVLEGPVVQAVVGGRSVARENTQGWRDFSDAAPWSEPVELHGAGREPLAVIDSGKSTITARLSGAEHRALIAALPPGSTVVAPEAPLVVRVRRAAAARMNRAR